MILVELTVSRQKMIKTAVIAKLMNDYVMYIIWLNDLKNSIVFKYITIEYSMY